MLVSLLFIAIPTSFFKFTIFAYILFVYTFIEYYSIASSYACVTIYVAKILPSVCMDGSNLTRAGRPLSAYAVTASDSYSLCIVSHSQTLPNVKEKRVWLRKTTLCMEEGVVMQLWNYVYML